MDIQRRTVLAAGAASLMPWLQSRAIAATEQDRLVLSRFTGAENYIIPNGAWRGFSDRVMGGISNANLASANIGGKSCLRLTGNVTRESNGGFIQMAMYFGRNWDELDASEYKGLELLVRGNNEDYNLHVRTSDCGWHDESYRMTFFAPDEWQRLRVPWESFEANQVQKPLNAGRLQRIALLGWMREFEADIALAELALYR